jgi:hypothetical protein
MSKNVTKLTPLGPVVQPSKPIEAMTYSELTAYMAALEKNSWRARDLSRDYPAEWYAALAAKNRLSDLQRVEHEQKVAAARADAKRLALNAELDESMRSTSEFYNGKGYRILDRE